MSGGSACVVKCDSWSWTQAADKGASECTYCLYILSIASSIDSSYDAPAFLCETRTTWNLIISDVCDAMPTPFPHWYIALCQRPSKSVCLRIRSGVSTQSCVSCEGTSHMDSPHKAHMLSSVYSDTPKTTPQMVSLLNPLCRQQKIWPRIQSPNHVIRHLRGQRSSRVAARCSCRGQRLMCLNTALFLMTSPQLIVSRYRNNKWL